MRSTPPSARRPESRLLNATPSGLNRGLNARIILFRKLSSGFGVIFRSLLKDRPAGSKFFAPLLIFRELLLPPLLGAGRRSGSRGRVHRARAGGRCGRRGRRSFRRGSAIGGRLDRLSG